MVNVNATLTEAVPTDPRRLRRLKQREIQEQVRLSVLESLKNNPRDWMRIMLAAIAGEVVFEINGSDVQAVIPALFTAGAFLTDEDAESWLIAAGVSSLPTVAEKAATLQTFGGPGILGSLIRSLAKTLVKAP